MTDSALPGVAWIPTSNFFANRNGQGPPRWLILHGTAGITDATQLGNYFKGTEGSNNPVSSHYGIGQDGAIAQYVAERHGAWANGVVTEGHDPWWSENDNPNPNDVTISIEHGKPDDANATALTAAQQASSFALVRDICTRNGIPMQPADAQGGITGHYSIDPVNRARCPGRYDWDALWAYLAGNGGNDMPLQITDPFAATHFTAIDDQHWKCNNGNIVQFAILAYYRFIQGAPRLPKTPEIYGAIPGHPDIVLQIFEGCAIVYVPDPAKSGFDNPGTPGGGHCFLIHLDQDNVALRQFMAFAGLQPATVTAEQVNTVINSMKSAQASLAVGVSTLEPSIKP